MERGGRGKRTDYGGNDCDLDHGRILGLQYVTSPFFDVPPDGDVTIVRIDRPPVNAIDPELAADGAALLDELSTETTGAVVITGTGA